MNRKMRIGIIVLAAAFTASVCVSTGTHGRIGQGEI